MPGTLYNVNTLERFREADRADILFTAAYDVWRAITTGEAERDPSLLNAFALLTFADLKRWAFTYWFAFPAIKLPEPIRVEKPPITLASRGEPGVAVAAACDDGSPPAARSRGSWRRNPPRHPPSRVIP